MDRKLNIMEKTKCQITQVKLGVFLFIVGSRMFSSLLLYDSQLTLCVYWLLILIELMTFYIASELKQLPQSRLMHSVAQMRHTYWASLYVLCFFSAGATGWAGGQWHLKCILYASESSVNSCIYVKALKCHHLFTRKLVSSQRRWAFMVIIYICWNTSKMCFYITGKQAMNFYFLLKRTIVLWLKPTQEQSTRHHKSVVVPHYQVSVQEMTTGERWDRKCSGWTRRLQSPCLCLYANVKFVLYKIINVCQVVQFQRNYLVLMLRDWNKWVVAYILFIRHAWVRKIENTWPKNTKLMVSVEQERRNIRLNWLN